MNTEGALITRAYLLLALSIGFEFAKNKFEFVPEYLGYVLFVAGSFIVILVTAVYVVKIIQKFIQKQRKVLEVKR